MFAPVVMGLGPTELLIIAGIIILLFGAAKLPELARGSGRALRIFKTETKGLMDDDDATTKTAEQREIEGRGQTTEPVVSDTDAETIRQRRDDPTA
jgi:sec-independent protein translocase protein TatA